MTKRSFCCRVDELAKVAAQNGIRKTALVVVGDFLGKDYARSRLYAPDFSTAFREAQT